MKYFKSVAIFLLITFLTGLAIADSVNIPVSNFEIVSFRGEWRDDRLYVIGEIKNIGNIAGGPQVEVIGRDSKGVLIDSKQFWPNSVNNISPGSSCGIKYNISEDPRAEKIEIKVISAKTW